MTTSFHLPVLALLAAAAVPTAASAQATTGPGTPYNFFSSATNTGTFGNNGRLANRNFTNTFTFIVTRSGKLAADFSNSASRNNTNGDIDFSSASLSGGSLLTPVSFTRLLGEPISLTEVWGMANPLRIAAGTYTLSIAGRAYGAASTLSGNFNVAAVPEPASWAMMIVGVGIVGGTLRRRRATTTTVRFA